MNNNYKIAAEKREREKKICLIIIKQFNNSFGCFCFVFSLIILFQINLFLSVLICV